MLTFIKDWRIKKVSDPLPCCLESIKARFQGSTKTETRSLRNGKATATQTENESGLGSKSEDVEEATLRWFSQARSHQIPVSGPVLWRKLSSLLTVLVWLTLKQPVGGWKRGRRATESSLRSSMVKNRMLMILELRDGSQRCCQKFWRTTVLEMCSMLMRPGSTGVQFLMERCHSNQFKHLFKSSKGSHHSYHAIWTEVRSWTCWWLAKAKIPDDLRMWRLFQSSTMLTKNAWMTGNI